MILLMLQDKYPDVYKLADKAIPQVWGSCRAAWMKGYLGLKDQKLWARDSVCERYYRMGREYRKEEHRNEQSKAKW